MKKQRIFALVTAVALALTAAACGTSATATSQSSVPSSQPESALTAPGNLSVPAENQQPQCVTPPEKITIRIAALKGPSAVGMLPLMDYSDNPETSITTANDYDFTMMGAPDQLVGGVVSGEYDIAVLPTNLAANVYNQTGGKVKLATINTLGVLYLLETGDSIQTVADLKGKTVYSSGKGSTPEYALNYVLEKNGLKVGVDVQVEYKTEHSEITALMAAGQAEIALLPQPFVEGALAQNDKLRVALDWTKEWEAVSPDGSSLAMSGIVIQQKLLDENPGAVGAFLEEYRNATAYVNDPVNLDAVAELAVRYEIIPKAPIAKKAIPQCNITFVAGEEMKTMAGDFLNILFEANPKSVGGKLPDDGFYYLP